MKDRRKNFCTLLSKDNLYMILNKIEEGIHIIDHTGKTIFYNEKVSEIDGLDPEEVLGKNLFEAYPSLTLETSSLMRTIKTGKPIYNQQQTFINFRGKKITTINHTFPLELKNGEIGALEISRDITQLEELVENLHTLRNNLGEGNKYRDNNQYQKNNTRYTFRDIIGKSDVMQEVIRDGLRAAGSNSSVLLVGETGTGKELFAQSIHNESARCNKPFIAQNCAALPKDLLEGLLFGTEKGGFTGAKSRPGLFEQADGGTILLDEINSMDYALQAKLLRVLEEGKIRRIGGKKELDINVRIIATMNTVPDRAFKKEKLREDLFYRLSVVYLELPPLRDRKEDIPLLTDYFIKYYNQRFSRKVKGVDKELEELFLIYDWPGNVRELKHVIESAYNMLQEKEVISYQNLPLYIKKRLKNKNSYLNKRDKTDEIPPLTEYLEEIEKDLIEKALNKTDNNISAAARNLEITRQSLQYKMKKYNLR